MRPYNEGNVLAQVHRTIERHRMAEPGQRWGVAVSGGPDSIALLEALRESAQRYRISLGVVHFNHKLRGAESEQDEAFVRDKAERLGLPFERAETTGEQAGQNLEAAARRERYAFFERLLAAGVFNRIATGHTRSDQAETVLFRVLRGASVAGLASIRPERAPGIVRPLIACSRAEVLAWLAERDLAWREDSSNRDDRFARNRLRRDLLPRLEAEWNPQIESALARLGDQAAAEEGYWLQTVDNALQTIVLGAADGGAEINCAAARVLHPAVLGRCLERLARQVKLSRRQLDADAIEQLHAMTLGSGPSEAHLPGLVARRSCDVLRLAPRAPAPSSPPPVAVQPPGELAAPDGRSRVLFRLIGPEPGVGGYNSGNRSLLDWDKLPCPLHLRVWRRGDRIAGPDGRQERLLREMFRRTGVPSWERTGWPVLATTGQEADKGDEVVVWSRGFGVSRGFAPSGSTTRALEVREIAGDGREIRRIEDWG